MASSRQPGQPVHPPPPRRLLVVMPTWLGDCVMATPVLRALRELYPGAHVAALIRNNVLPLLEGTPWVDRFLPVELSDGPGRGSSNVFSVASRLWAEDFDSAVLLPNSFRSASLTAIARIPRRVGYDRDGRGFLLTDRLIPRRAPRPEGGGFVPVPTLTYYLALASYLGAVNPDPAMALFTDPEEDTQTRAMLAEAGCDLAGGDRLVLLNPGAQKPVKRWPAERYAAAADALVAEHGCRVAVTGAPAERVVLDKVIDAASVPVIDLPSLGVGLKRLKSVVKLASLMMTNDTGPRHVAAALGTPVVSLFGPTVADWTQIDFDHERQIHAGGGPASPAEVQRITVARVVQAASELLQAKPAGTHQGVGAGESSGDGGGLA